MHELVVIGAGVVGLACAVEFQRRGSQVTLLDPADPGHECSFGNAGIIATSEIFPIVSPAHVRSLPRMLLSRDAPASIRPDVLPSLIPWFWRAAGSLGTERQQAITATLCTLNRLALPAWRSLLAQCGAGDLLSERGMLRLVRDGKGQAALDRHRQALASYSIPAEILSAEQVRELEPGLHSSISGGLLHGSDAHVRNPLDISLALLKRFREAGGTVVNARALGIRPGDRGPQVFVTGSAFDARQVLVTAGLDSGPLIEPHGPKVPLQAERGYHLMLPGGGERVRRPVTFQAESCVATPMGPSLRLAGTVEFARRASPPTWSRSDRLASIAQRYFTSPLPLAGAGRWVGSRPSLPDSLPAIGRLAAFPQVGYAFGHQHLGLTQAAVSAALLADLMQGITTPIDMRPFDIGRFQ